MTSFSIPAIDAASPAGDTGLEPVECASVAASASASSPFGRKLLSDLRAELPALSPKLREVAMFCIGHSSTLHKWHILELAAACKTTPASVVRLAQRLGLKGYQDLRIAFLGGLDERLDDRTTRAALVPVPSSDAIRGLDAVSTQIEAMKSLVSRPAFLDLADELAGADSIEVVGVGAADQLVASHVAMRLRPLAARRASGRGPWLIRVMLEPGEDVRRPVPQALRYGPRVLQFVGGRVSRTLTRTPAGSIVRLGRNPENVLCAWIFGDALATAAIAAAAGGAGPPMPLSFVAPRHDLDSPTPTLQEQSA